MQRMTVWTQNLRTNSGKGAESEECNCHTSWIYQVHHQRSEDNQDVSHMSSSVRPWWTNSDLTVSYAYIVSGFSAAKELSPKSMNQRKTL